jgi:two-component system response regulator YesN
MLIGLPIGENDSHSFGLDWIMNASHIGMMVSLFEKNQTDKLIKRVDSINQIMTKLYVNSITVCLFEGVLITIIATTDIIDDAFMSSPNSILIGALQECISGPVHIDSVYNNKHGTSLPMLYLKAIQRNALLLPGPSVKALEERRSKSSIIESVVSLIEHHYQDYLTTEVIAKHLHFTPNYLGLIFKTEKKISVNRYVLLVRLNHAKKLLEENEPIADIAAKCGFESITYFYSTFKKETGMTPSEFRSHVQKA